MLTAKKLQKKELNSIWQTLTHPPYVAVPLYALCSTHFDLWKQVVDFFHCVLYFYSIADCYSDAVGNYSDTAHNCIKSHTNSNWRNCGFFLFCSCLSQWGDKFTLKRTWKWQDNRPHEQEGVRNLTSTFGCQGFSAKVTHMTNLQRPTSTFSITSWARLG